MPKISTYGTVSPDLNDKLIGTDANDNLATKNFTVESLRDLIVLNEEFNVLGLVNLSNQELSAANTKTQVTFGPAETNDYFEVNAGGDVTTVTAGNYRINVLLNSGVINTSQSDRHVDFFYSFDKGISQQFNTIQNTVYFDASDSNPAQTISMNFVKALSVGDVLRFFQAASLYVPSGSPSVMRTGLVTKSTGTILMNNVPSAAIYIYKI
jgi:hypothetical protein